MWGWSTLALPSLLLAVGMATPAWAAVPSVLDVAGGGEGVDAHASVRVVTLRQTSRIAAEVACRGELGVCPPGAGDLVFARELDATLSRHAMVADFRLGFRRGLELRVELPVVFAETTDVAYVPGVGPQNTRLGDGLLTVPATGPSRSGLGDMVVGIRYAPLLIGPRGDEPTLVFEVAYTAPTGRVMRSLAPVGGQIRTGNTGVGEGVHRIRLAIDGGAQVLPWLVPWIGVSGEMAMVSDQALYVTGFRTQRLEKPGSVLELEAGLGFTLWDEPASDEHAVLSISARATHTGDGRQASVLFDHLGASPCSQDPACMRSRTTVVTDPTNPIPDPVNGITSVQAHTRVGAGIELSWRPAQVFELRAHADVAMTPTHFLTYAHPGYDLNGDFELSQAIDGGGSELSPIYVPGIDEVGRRLQQRSTIELGAGLSLTGRF